MSKLKLEVLLAAVDKLTGPLRQAIQGNRQLAQAVKASRDQLKGLQKQQADISSLRKQQAALQATRQQLDAAQAKLRDLKTAQRSGASQSASFTRAMRKSHESVRDLTRQIARQQRSLAPLRSRLAEAGITVSKLASAENQLKNKIDSATAALARQDAALGRANRKQQQLIATQARYRQQMAMRDSVAGIGRQAMGGGAVIGAGMAMPIMAYARAEDSATRLKGAMMRAGGTTPPEYQRINALAEKLGDRLPGTTADFQDMMTMLMRQGMSAKAVLGGLGEATAYLGVQLKMAPEAAAEFTAKLQDATRTSEQDMMGLVDMIQRGFYAGVDSNNMLEAYKGLGAAMDMIKVQGLAGAKAFAPFVVMMDQAGMRGESAGNAMRKVIAASLNVDKIRHVQEDLREDRGIALSLDFTNGKGEFAGIDQLMAQLNKLKGLNTVNRLAVLKGIFGDDKETNEVLSKIIEKGQTGYDEVVKNLAEQASLQERINQQLGTLKNLWDAASGTFTNAMVKFGEAIAPETKAAVEWLGQLAERLGHWAKANPALANSMMRVAAFTGIALLAVGGLALALAALLGPMALVKLSLGYLLIHASGGAGIFSRLAGGVRLLGSAFLWLSRAMLLNPIGLVISAIMGLAALAWLVYRQWDKIGPWFTGLWESIRNKAIQAGRGMADYFLNWTLPGLIIQHWNSIKTFMSGLVSNFMRLGGQIMQGLINGFLGGLGLLKQAINGVGGSAIGWFKEKLGIHSPSRVFAELGGYTMQGLAQGIHNGGRHALATVTGLSKQLLAAGAGISLGIGGTAMAGPLLDSRPPLKATAESRTPMTVNMPISIQAAPGMNEQQLAQQIAREVSRALTRAQQQQAARQRSRLGDFD